MSKSFIANTMGVFLFASMTTLSALAGAATNINYKEVPGTVTSLNKAESTITITTTDGNTKTFNLAKGVKVATDKGRRMSLISLVKGDTVILKQRIYSPIASETKASVLSANQ